MSQENNIKARYLTLLGDMKHHAILALRAPEDIKILAVSKKKPAIIIEQAYAVGIRDFGENYLQEALAKMQKLQQLKINWHFIGPIQSNKAVDIARNFSWVHSVDRLKIAEKLNTARENHPQPLHICIQVNIDAEPSKSGVSLEDLPALAKAISALPNLKLRGLMALPKKRKSLEAQRAPYRQLKNAQRQLAKEGMILDTLSIGTSHDYVAAMFEGATWIRIGEALLGQRD